MNKKFKVLALLLVLALSFNMVSVFAATSPKGQDLTKVESYKGTDNVVPEPAFIIYVTQPTDPWQQDMDAVAELTKAGKTPIEFFDDAVKADVANLLPAGTDLAALQMNEFVPISALNYEEAYGDVTAAFEFPTQYAEGQPLVALAAVYTLVNSVTNEWSAEWFACAAEAKMGKVYITFPADYVAKLEGGWGSLAILN